MVLRLSQTTCSKIRHPFTNFTAHLGEGVKGHVFVPDRVCVCPQQHVQQPSQQRRVLCYNVANIWSGREASHECVRASTAACACSPFFCICQLDRAYLLNC